MCSPPACGSRTFVLYLITETYLCVLREKTKKKNINKAEVYTQIRVKRQIRIKERDSHKQKSEANRDYEKIGIGILVVSFNVQ